MRHLADNAVRYAPRGARVEVRVPRPEGMPALQVDNSGPGTPPAERQRVFDRFYDSDLGLAFVRGVARRHGAAVDLGDSPLDGLCVTLHLAARPGEGLALTGWLDSMAEPRWISIWRRSFAGGRDEQRAHTFAARLEGERYHRSSGLG